MFVRVTISITAEAFEAIKAMLLMDRDAEARPDGEGGFHITLSRNILDRLKALAVPERATAMLF